MLLSIASSFTRWLSQIVSLISREMTQLQPQHYAVGLVACIGLGYLLLRGRH